MGDVSNLLTNDHPAVMVADIMANTAAAVSTLAPDDEQGVASGQHGEGNCRVCGVLIVKNLLRSHVCSNRKVT